VVYGWRQTAACTQSVYNTAYHALINLARIKKGDTVLIHAAVRSLSSLWPLCISHQVIRYAALGPEVCGTKSSIKALATWADHPRRGKPNLGLPPCIAQ
jgi:hypothetical protein